MAIPGKPSTDGKPRQLRLYLLDLRNKLTAEVRASSTMLTANSMTLASEGWGESCEG